MKNIKRGKVIISTRDSLIVLTLRSRERFHDIPKSRRIPFDFFSISREWLNKLMTRFFISFPTHTYIYTLLYYKTFYIVTSFFHQPPFTELIKKNTYNIRGVISTTTFRICIKISKIRGGKWEIIKNGLFFYAYFWENGVRRRSYSDFRFPIFIAKFNEILN